MQISTNNLFNIPQINKTANTTISDTDEKKLTDTDKKALNTASNRPLEMLDDKANMILNKLFDDSGMSDIEQIIEKKIISDVLSQEFTQNSDGTWALSGIKTSFDTSEEGIQNSLLMLQKQFEASSKSGSEESAKRLELINKLQDLYQSDYKPLDISA